MTGPGHLGSVEVDVELNIADIGPRLRRALRRPAERIGEEMERAWGRSGTRSGAAYGDAMRAAMRRASRGMAAESTRVGADVADRLRDALAAATREEQLLQIDADITKAHRKLAELRDQDLTVEVDAEIQRALARIRALTARRDLLQLQLDIDGAGVARRQLDDVSDSGRQLASVLGNVVATGSKIGVIGAAAVGAVGGLSSLTLGAVGLTSALAQASGTVATLPALFSGAAASITALVVGFQGMGEALGAVMDEDPDKLADALEELTPAAQAAVRAFQRLRPALEDIREATQESLFAGLDDEIRRLDSTLLPQLERGLSRVAEGLNTQFEALLASLADTGNLSQWDRVFDNTAVAAEKLAPAIEDTVAALSTLAGVGSGTMPRLADATARAADQFNRFIQNAEQTGELAGYINRSIDGLTQLGRIVGNVGAGIGNVFNAAEASTGGFAQSLEDLTAQFRAWSGSLEGQETLSAFFESLHATAEAATPVVREFVDSVARDLAPVVAQLAQTLGPAVADAIARLGDGVDAAGPGLVQLAEGLADLLDAAAPLLPIIGEIAALLAGTLGQAITVIAGVIRPVAEGFRALNDAMGGVPAQLAAAAAGFVALRAAIQKLNLRNAAKDATRGLGDELSSSIERETRKAEKTARDSGSRIGAGLKRGLGGALGVGALAGVVGSAMGEAGKAIEDSGDQLGESIGTALKLGVAVAGPWGAGVAIANEIIAGLTGVDLIGTVGGWIGDAVTALGDAWDQITGKTSEVNARLREMGAAISQIQVPAAETRERLIELVQAAREGDMTAITTLRSELAKLPGLSNETRAALVQALNAAKGGDFTGLDQLQGALQNLRVEVEGFGSVLESIFGEGGPPAITSMRELFGLVDEISEGARAAKPPLDELKGSVEGLGEAAGQAGQSGQFLNEYLEGMMPSSYNAQLGVDGLSNALLRFQESSTNAASSAGMMSHAISESVGSAALSFMTHMNGMAALAVTVWESILGITQSSLANQRSAVHSGMQEMTAATRGGFNQMVSAASAGSNRVVATTSDLRSRIVSSMQGLSGAMRSVGADAMDGLAMGIISRAGRAAAAAASAAARAISAVRAAFDSHSPSRVMMRIGEDAAEGMRLGLLHGASRVAAAGETLAWSAVGGAGGAMSGMPGLYAPGMSGSSRTYHRTNHVTNHVTVTTAATDPRAVAALVKTRLDSAVAGVM